MNPRRWLVVAMIALLPAPALSQQKQPDPKPRGIEKATAEAWAKRGFDAGWLRERGGRVWLTTDYPKSYNDAIPALWYRGAANGLTDENLKELPPVEVPFALRLPGPNKVTDAGLEHLGHFANLTWLDLGSAPITGEGFKHFAELKKLTALKSSYSGVTDASLKHLAGNNSLTVLDLSATRVTDEGPKELAGLKNLTSLGLSDTRITDAGLKYLTGLANLTELALINDTHVTDAGLVHLAGLTNLTSLHLWASGVTGRNLRPLAGLKKLHTFSLKHEIMTDEHLRALSQIGLLHALDLAGVHSGTEERVEDGRRPAKPEDVRSFDLRDTSATGEGVKYLAAFPNLGNLFLGECQVTPEGLKHVAGLKNLAVLFLDSGAITGEGLEHLAGLKNLTSLRVFWTGSAMTRKGLKHLTDLKHLTTLDVPIADETLQALGEDGALHLLPGAEASGGQRPATDDDIVSLNLSGTDFKGAGLKSVAKLKTLATLDLSNARVRDVWVEDFQRTRPKCKVIK